MNDLDKIKRHLAKPIPVILKNVDGEEDIFLLKPLNVEQQAILMELSKRMNSKEKIKIDGKEVPDVGKEDMIEMVNLLIDICKNSMSEVDDESITTFVNDNFDQLSNKIVDLIPKNPNASGLAKIKKAQEEYNVRKSK